jgi:hypothetical protein
MKSSTIPIRMLGISHAIRIANQVLMSRLLLGKPWLSAE